MDKVALLELLKSKFSNYSDGVLSLYVDIIKKREEENKPCLLVFFHKRHAYFFSYDKGEVTIETWIEYDDFK